MIQPNNEGQMVIVRLVPNGPADLSGKVRPGDLLVSVDGMQVQVSCETCAVLRARNACKWKSTVHIGQPIVAERQSDNSYVFPQVQGWKMADILRMIVGEDESFVTLGVIRAGCPVSSGCSISCIPVCGQHQRIHSSTSVCANCSHAHLPTGESFSASIRRSAKPMPSGHTPGSVTVTKQQKVSFAGTPEGPPPPSVTLASPSAAAAADTVRQKRGFSPGGEADNVSLMSSRTGRTNSHRTALLTITAQPE